MEIIAHSAGELVHSAIKAVMDHGKEVTARGKTFKELIGVTLVLKNPKKNIYLIDGRKNNPICLSGDTKISLLNGTEVPIKDLVGLSEFWVYSCTPEGKIVPGHAHSARVTKTVNELCVVTLDTQEKIKCTPEHPFMLRDGSYREAKDLKPEDSLMPLYRRIDSDGYEEILHNDVGDNWQLTHQNIVWKISSGYVNTRKMLKSPQHRAICSYNIFVENKFRCAVRTGFKGSKKEFEGTLNSDKSSFISKKVSELSINHKVDSIGFITETCDVYDITVDNYNNFALSAGVFVHNCMLFETLWVWAGRSDILTLQRFLKRAPDYSDDGVFWRAGYGSRLFNPVNQLDAVFRRLKHDPNSRQAVMVEYLPLDLLPVPYTSLPDMHDADDAVKRFVDASFVTKDVPCNDLQQFLIRDDKLHLINTVRSNDCIFGLSGINLYEFTFLQNAMANLLGVQVGEYIHHAGSLHIYDTHYKKAETILSSKWTDLPEDIYDFGYPSGSDINDFVRDCQKAILLVFGGMQNPACLISSPLILVLARIIISAYPEPSVVPIEGLFNGPLSDYLKMMPATEKVLNEYLEDNWVQ